MLTSLLTPGGENPDGHNAGGDGAAGGQPGLAYAFRPSLIGPAHQFALDDDGLTARIGRRTEIWAYDDIASVRLSYRPMGMQHRRYRADIRHRNGRRIVIFSTSKQTAALMAPQSGYSAFIAALHRRLAQSGSAAVLTAGVQPVTYALLRVVLAVFALAMAALLLRALWIGAFAGAIFIVGFGALFAWQVGGVLRRNRPRIYALDDIPRDLLP